jgi:quercetin dioxygenase-like cupin family protein
MLPKAIKQLIAFLIFGCSSIAAAAECPVGERGIDVQPPGPTETLGEQTVTLLGYVLLGQGIDNRVLRLRRITVFPGAQIGWHEHGDRSLLLFVESGTYTEYRSDCRVPIRHEVGSTIQEAIGTKHWWRNEGQVPVVLLVSDITTPDAVQKLNLPPR